MIRSSVLLLSKSLLIKWWFDQEMQQILSVYINYRQFLMYEQVIVGKTLNIDHVFGWFSGRFFHFKGLTMINKIEKRYFTNAIVDIISARRYLYTKATANSLKIVESS